MFGSVIYEPAVAMTPFAPIVGYEGGREHLKALLRLPLCCDA